MSKQNIVAQVHSLPPSVTNPNVGGGDINSSSTSMTTTNSDASSILQLETVNGRKTAAPKLGANIISGDGDAISSKQSSRDVSIDEESQINSKIITLIESELRRDNKNCTNFAGSRPESLTFYEKDGQLTARNPEDLSGDLEMVSPVDVHHMKSRKNRRNNHHRSNHDQEDDTTDAEHNHLSNSREIILPRRSNQRSKQSQSKVVTLETPSGIDEPSAQQYHHQRTKRTKRIRSSRNHNSITKILNQFEDDIIDVNNDGVNDYLNHQQSSQFSTRDVHLSSEDTLNPTRMYVQRSSGRFQMAKETTALTQFASPSADANRRDSMIQYPIQMALILQKRWMRFTNLCHGLLAGFALAQCLYIVANIYVENEDFLEHYSRFSLIYVAVFYVLCTICCVSALEKIDLANLPTTNLATQLRSMRVSLCVAVMYFVCLIIHLSATRIDYKLGLISTTMNITQVDISEAEIHDWNHLSIWRSILAFIPWLMLAFSTEENRFYLYLTALEQYIPPTAMTNH